jgi:hypothetical protein
MFPSYWVFRSHDLTREFWRSHPCLLVLCFFRLLFNYYLFLFHTSMFGFSGIDNRYFFSIFLWFQVVDYFYSLKFIDNASTSLFNITKKICLALGEARATYLVKLLKVYLFIDNWVIKIDATPWFLKNKKILLAHFSEWKTLWKTTTTTLKNTFWYYIYRIYKICVANYDTFAWSWIK